MMTFRTWLEATVCEEAMPLSRQQQAQIAKLYRQVFDVLGLGGAQNQQLSLSLSDIQDERGGDRPPQRGPRIVKDKLEKSGIYQAMSKIPALDARAQQTRQYLDKLASDQQIGPSDTLGKLLNRLFGDDAVDLYGKERYKTSPVSEPKAPQDSHPVTPDATAAPAAQQAAPLAQVPQPDPTAMQGMPAPGGPPPGSMPGGPMPAPPLNGPGARCLRGHRAGFSKVGRSAVRSVRDAAEGLP